MSTQKEKEELRDFLLGLKAAMKGLEQEMHTYMYEQKKVRESMTNFYNYFTAIDRSITSINNRVQMLELRIAKESDGGHA